MYLFQSLYVPHGSISAYHELISLARSFNLSLDELMKSDCTFGEMIDKIRGKMDEIRTHGDNLRWTGWLDEHQPVIESIITSTLRHIDPTRKLGNYRSSSYEARFVVIRKKLPGGQQYTKPIEAASVI